MAMLPITENYLFFVSFTHQCLNNYYKPAELNLLCNSLTHIPPKLHPKPVP